MHLKAFESNNDGRARCIRESADALILLEISADNETRSDFERSIFAFPKIFFLILGIYALEIYVLAFLPKKINNTRLMQTASLIAAFLVVVIHGKLSTEN